MRKEINSIIAITTNWLAWLSIVGMGFLVLIVFYWSFWPYNVIEVVQPASILNTDKRVARGSILSYRMDYVKYINVSAKVRRMLENDRQICLIEEAGQAKMGKQSVIIDVQLPPNIWPGKYKLKTIYEYDINPIRTLKYEYYTEWFEVLP